MERLKVTITARSPLCFSERRPAGQFRESTEYVPGGVVRGAVAMLMLEDRQESSKAFRELFVGERRAVFSNAYPAYPDPRLLPATAMSCKAESDFRPKGDGVVDTLIDRLCFETLKPAGLLYLPKCSHCGMRMERHAAFYYRDGGGFRAGRVTARLLTRVAINRRRATAEDELLYSPVVISEGKVDMDGNYQEAKFTGTIVVAAHADVLQRYLQQVEHLGSGSSRGLGHVKVEVERTLTTDEEELQSLRERREELTAAIKETWSELQELPGCAQPSHNPDEGAYFTVDLYGDTVLKEQGWLPTMVLSQEMLKDRCGVDDEDIRLVRAYSGYDYRGGWNVAWGLPKDVDVVVPMGSVFVFWTKHPDRWDEALLHLQRWGLGDRTAEGFGQVRICDEFHVQARKENPV